MKMMIYRSLVVLFALVVVASSQIKFEGDGGADAGGDADVEVRGGEEGGEGGEEDRGGRQFPQIVFPREDGKLKIPCTTYHGKQGSCRLLLRCATFFAEIAELSRSPCTISSEQQGVCCPPSEEVVTDIGGLISKQQTVSDVPVPIQFPEVNHACELGIKDVTDQEQFESFLLQNNVVAERGSPMSLHSKLFRTTEEIVKKAKDAAKNVAASVHLVQDFHLSKEQGGFGLPRFGIQNTVIQDTCPKEPICPETKYRAMDATCNNLRNKNWGSAGTAFQRILAPDYNDGVNQPRSKAVSGNPLPSPREISSMVIIDKDNVYDNFSLLIMQWGQFLDHDFTHTPLTKGKNMSTITCCTKAGGFLDTSVTHPECLPIEIPVNDPFYSKHNRRCMDFVRSLPAPRPECNLGPREQMNQITGFIDASNVYGSSDKESAELRTFSGGLLKENEEKHLLPPETDTTACSPLKQSTNTKFCFKAGDSRVNEQPQLAVMHTLWMREHNRLARELARLNPGWSDNILYQEARRIVAAEMQHITYNEYLPIVLGKTFMQAFGLVPRQSGYATRGYREDIDPTITNVFATAAFRYGHTLISGNMQAFSPFGTVQDDLKLSENQFSPFYLYREGGFDALVRGIAIQPSQKFDHFFSEQLTNHLFSGGKAFGMDLVALNIQRGRDHGLPAYNKWRQICGLPLARSFQDLADVIDAQVIRQLQTLYEDVNDIDIFIGGIAEKPKEGSLLGHTFLCIVGDQFARLRLGDRFYYENGGLESSFREEQLDEIRHASLARIFCDNAEGVEMLQPLVFIKAHLANKRVSCRSSSDIPRVSLEPWRNEPVWA